MDEHYITHNQCEIYRREQKADWQHADDMMIDEMKGLRCDFRDLSQILTTFTATQTERDNNKKPPIFQFLQEKGNISEDEMYHVFNRGIGYVLIVEPEEADEVIALLYAMGKKAYRIGEIVAREEGSPPVRIVSE